LGARSSPRRAVHMSSLPRLAVKISNICLRGHNDMCDIRWRAYRLSIDNIWTCCNQMDIMVTVRVGRRISGDTIYFSLPLQRTGMFASHDIRKYKITTLLLPLGHISFMEWLNALRH